MYYFTAAAAAVQQSVPGIQQYITCNGIYQPLPHVQQQYCLFTGIQIYHTAVYYYLVYSACPGLVYVISYQL